MRNRIARLITIGLTTVSMTLTALSGAAPITLTAYATESGTNAAPNGGAEATRGGSAGGVQTERDYDKGAAANGRKVVYYEDKYGAKDNYPNKYKGAEIKDPDYAIEEGYPIESVKSNKDEYIISVLKPELGGDSTSNYFILTVDRASVNKEGDVPKTLNIYEMNKNGTIAKKSSMQTNSGILGDINVNVYDGRRYLLRFDDTDMAEHNAIGVLDNRYELRSLFDRFYLNGKFPAEGYYLNRCYRVFSLDESMLKGNRTQHNTTDMLPNYATQTTEYIGIDENGNEILLDTFVITGLTGQTYVAPGPNSYKGWIYDPNYKGEPATRTGSLGKEYKPEDPSRIDQIGYFIRTVKVLDDDMNVRIRLYRQVSQELYDNMNRHASGTMKQDKFFRINDDEKNEIYKDKFGNRYYLVEQIELPEGNKTIWYPDYKDTYTLGNLVLETYTDSTHYYGPEAGLSAARRGKTILNRAVYVAGKIPYIDKITGKMVSPGGMDTGLFNPLQKSPQNIKYYYKLAPAEPVSPETPNVESEGAKTTIKKALELVNVAHDYIPSVPDVIFNYEVVYDLYGTVVYDDGTETYGKDKTPVGYLVQGIDAGGFPSIRVGVDKGVATDIYDNGPDSIYEDKKIKDSFGNETTVLDANGNPVRTLKKEALYARYTPVAYGKDINDTEFEIWRGPIGGIKLTDVETGVKSHKGTVRFHHDDIANGDTAAPNTGDGVNDNREDMMTKKLQVEVVEDAFKAPGVYRYILQERGGDERAMTEWDSNAEKGKTESAVLDDIEHKVEKEIRYLDIYVEWNGSEDKLIVKDMVLHNISGKLDYATHGSFALEKEGGTDNSGQSTALLGTEGKKDAFTESTYTTYDLVVGKEIMGKGLTDYDITKRVFTFKVTINAPSYTLIKAARGAEETSGNINWRFPVPENGVLVPYTKSKDTNREFIIKVKQGEWVLLSGIPSGSTYEVEEVDDWSDQNSEHPALFENYYSSNMKEMIEATDNRRIQALAGQNNGSMLEDQPRRNTYMMMLQNRLDALANGKEFVNSTQEELVDDLVNVSGPNNPKTTGKITMSKFVNDQIRKSKYAENPASYAIDNVFFLNLRRDNVVTGVAMSVAPYALMVLAGVIAIGGFLVVKKRKDAADLDEE